jgi:hypothetical protein
MKQIFITYREADNMRNNCIDERTGMTEWDSFVMSCERKHIEVVECAEEEE